MYREHNGNIFRNRESAGRLLGSCLTHLAARDPIVLAVPRGGVPVGYEVAKALDAPLDVVVARKIGAPFQQELGIGAIAPDDICVLDDSMIQMLDISDEQIERTIEKQKAEMERRLRQFRGSLPMPDLTERTAIVVDDGIATGVTTRAALDWARSKQPSRLVLAAPVCAADTADRLVREVDEFVCLLKPEAFIAVGLWYSDFTQITDEEVAEILARARKEYADRFVALAAA